MKSKIISEKRMIQRYKNIYKGSKGGLPTVFPMTDFLTTPIWWRFFPWRVFLTTNFSDNDFFQRRLFQRCFFQWRGLFDDSFSDDGVFPMMGSFRRRFFRWRGLSEDRFSDDRDYPTTVFPMTAYFWGAVKGPEVAPAAKRLLAFKKILAFKFVVTYSSKYIGFAQMFDYSECVC